MNPDEPPASPLSLREQPPAPPKPRLRSIRPHLVRSAGGLRRLGAAARRRAVSGRDAAGQKIAAGSQVASPGISQTSSTPTACKPMKGTTP